MWQVYASDVYQRREKRFANRHETVLYALHKNLTNVQKILQFTNNPRNLAQHSKVRNEGGGLFAIDQRGAKRKLREARLYFYPDFEAKIIHLLTIGFKQSQSNDILFCRKCVQAIEEEKRDGQ